MGEKLVVGPFNRGLRNDLTAFNIDNDSFPVLINAYQWRGRVKRKRGTSQLGRLTSISLPASLGVTDASGNFSGNVITIILLGVGTLAPGTIVVTDGTNTFTDNGSGIITGVPAGSGTINYASGAITITGAVALHQLIINFSFYINLPVMGLEDFVTGNNAFPGTIAFDTKFSYKISTSFPYPIYNVNFFKNPPASASLPGYVQKAAARSLGWNGQDYQQFWTVNYQGALWTTNGINIPFNPTNVGMQYKAITGVAIVAGGPPAIVNLTIAASGLDIGDFLFVNEITGMTGINFQTGYVTAVAGALVTVEFPNATIGGAYTGGGIAQYLTNIADSTKDSLRWYDGDPTTSNNGWVNFSPPLSQLKFSISDEPDKVYYLVGARMIVPFKDRLLFIGPVIQTSAAGSQVYLQDTVIFSQNGTAFYTASFTGDPLNPTSPPGILPILVPDEQTATSTAYWEDQTGFGGYIQAGIDQPITTASFSEDVLILGFGGNIQTLLAYSGNDIIPFNFFIINSEYGSSSTFSTINMDKGVVTRSNRGYVITNQKESKRIDLEIPDEVFQMRLTSNGNERVCAQRDFINEWAYFTYPVNFINYKFPTQTLQYNYRDDSWAIFRESYTTYGQFREQTGLTWATVGAKFPTWASWNQPWNSGASTLLQPKVIAGNQQGFVMIRDDGTDEGESLYIKDIVGSTVTSPDHCLSNGDYIVINGALGTVSSQVNGKIFSVSLATQNTFVLNPPLSSATYSGGGLIIRMYVPFIQTKQFPMAWGMGRKTRIGVQQYLFTTTDDSQVQLLIYLSQNSASPYNNSNIVPQSNVVNSSLIYSTVLYTCPESANLGLTPANTNLQMISEINAAGTFASSPSDQIWHRMNTSLIGDTVQIGFTLSDVQMRDATFTNQFSEIELHGMIIDINPSQMLS